MTQPHDHDDPRYAVKKSDAEWRAELDPMQYQVARHAATERPFTGKYWDPESVTQSEQNRAKSLM